MLKMKVISSVYIKCAFLGLMPVWKAFVGHGPIVPYQRKAILHQYNCTPVEHLEVICLIKT